MSFTYRHRKEIFLITIVIILLSIGGIYFYNTNFKEKKKKKTPQTILIEKSPTTKKNEEKRVASIYKVDIKGAVNNPGIYSFNNQERIIDVINQAGGLTNDADTTVINLSKKIKDEMVIIIYTKSEVLDFKKTKEQENEVIKKCIQKDADSIKNDACLDTNDSKTFELTGKININTATLDELKSLPGIGESKAQNIIKYRAEKGNFTDISKIKEVEGIGDSLYAQIEAYITIE